MNVAATAYLAAMAPKNARLVQAFAQLTLLSCCTGRVLTPTFPVLRESNKASLGNTDGRSFITQGTLTIRRAVHTTPRGPFTRDPARVSATALPFPHRARRLLQALYDGRVYQRGENGPLVALMETDGEGTHAGSLLELHLLL